MAFVAPLFAGIGSFLGGTGGTLLTAGLGVAGAVASAAGARAQSSYQAQVAENNAKIAKQNASNASDAAQIQQIEQDNQTRAFIGSQETAQSASGLSLSGGSQLRTRRTAQILGAQDRQSIRDQGQSTIQNYLQQSENFTSEASSARAQGRGALLKGFFDATGSLISSATSIKNPGSITGSGLASTSRKRLNTLGTFGSTYKGGNY